LLCEAVAHLQLRSQRLRQRSSHPGHPAPITRRPELRSPRPRAATDPKCSLLEPAEERGVTSMKGMKGMKFLNRRRFLRGMAGVTVGLPLLESVGTPPLSAQGAGPVTRFLSFHCSSGVETDRFWPSLGTLTAESFAGKGTEALSPYASRLLIPRGVHGY